MFLKKGDNVKKETIIPAKFQRRDFLNLSLALGLYASLPPLVLAKSKDKLDIWGAPAIPSTILKRASEAGELAKRFELKLNIWKNPDELRVGFTRHLMPITMSPSNVGVALLNQGFRVGMLNVLTNGLVEVIVKNGVEVNDMASLASKKIIMPFKNDMPDLCFQALLDKNGLDYKGVNIDYTATPPEALGLFLKKDYDALIVPESMASMSIFRSSGAAKRAFSLCDEWEKAFGVRSIPQAGLIVDLDFYESNKESVEIFEQDLKDALAWIKSNGEAAASMGKKVLGLPIFVPERVVMEAFSHANLTVSRASENKEELMEFFNIIHSFNPKFLGNKLPPESFFL